MLASVMILMLATWLSGCGPTPLPEPSTSHEPAELTRVEDIFGVFYAYVPLSTPEEPEIVVLIHGTPAKNKPAEATAQLYTENWLDFAEANGYILIVPAFNQENFSSLIGDHAMGGYRGLFGREIAADEWVLRLVKAHQQTYGAPDRQFYLYGHSAGGQFVGRFLMTHPELIKRAVISAAATYPQPNTDVAWPFGMGELKASIEWDEDTVNQVDIVPDKQKWLAATQVPLTVIVGLNDITEVPSLPGQKGKTRFVIARNWLKDMALFAEENGLESRFQIEIIPGKGHSMYGLISYTQEALVAR